MFQAFHVISRAHGSTRYVLADRDCFELLRGIVRAYGKTLLGYCLMPNHVHVVAEGAEDVTRNHLAVVLRAYARAFGGRHEGESPIVRGDLKALPIPGSTELGVALRYVHDNPVEPAVPLAPSAVAYEWSSARSFVGLVRSSPVNVTLACDLLGKEVRRLKLASPTLADLQPALVPCAPPELLAAAAAQAWGVLGHDVASDLRHPRLAAARCTYAALGRLESYTDRQLAPTLGRVRSRVTQLMKRADHLSIRIARTLLVMPELRSRQKPVLVTKESSPEPGTREAARCERALDSRPV
jgi:hypothetical protein